MNVFHGRITRGLLGGDGGLLFAQPGTSDEKISSSDVAYQVLATIRAHLAKSAQAIGLGPEFVDQIMYLGKPYTLSLVLAATDEAAEPEQKIGSVVAKDVLELCHGDEAAAGYVGLVLNEIIEQDVESRIFPVSQNLDVRKKAFGGNGGLGVLLMVAVDLNVRYVDHWDRPRPPVLKLTDVEEVA